MAKKIGILGSGIVGKTLAEGFKKHGYEVRQGSRHEFQEIAKSSEILVLAVKGTAAEAALKLIGAENLKWKIVMDTTNPIADAPPQDGVLQFFTGGNESLMERLQTAYPETHFVKAFSSVGSALMVNPKFQDARPTMFICGNNSASKIQIAAIVEQFGWEVEDMGTAKAAQAIEPLCKLWCLPGFRENRWSHAFKLLKT